MRDEYFEMEFDDDVPPPIVCVSPINQGEPMPSQQHSYGHVCFRCAKVIKGLMTVMPMISHDGCQN